MAIRNSSFLLIALILLMGCQIKTTRPDRPVGARPTVTEPTPETPAEPQAPQPPEKHEPKRVAVILGPGGAKAFAHVGVLKAFQQQRIPIEKIVGLEWGALVGGLYSVKGQVHDVEWKLYKMEQNNPFEPKGFFSRKTTESDIAVMDGFLRDAFGGDDLSRTKIPFTCPSRSLANGSLTWQTRGAFREMLKRCMLYPPIFKARLGAIAAPTAAGEAVEALVKEGFNVVILVNVLGTAQPFGPDALRDNLNHAIIWQEVRHALGETSRLNIDVVNVDTDAYPITRLAAKKELIQLGENAGGRAARELISKYGF